MRNLFAASALTILALTSSTALAQSTTQPAGVMLSKTTQFDLPAADGYVYKITVAEPKGDAPANGFGVLFVLDANASFFTIAEATRFQKGLHPTIVVGINAPGDALDYPRRYKDLTPYTKLENLTRRSSSSEGNVSPEGTGGQDQFLAWLENTLKPEIARRYKVDATKHSLFGHSLSARFVLHVLATRPDAFNAYIACSPSVWWDRESLLPELEALAARGQLDSPKTAVIYVGEYEQKPSPGTSPDRAAFFAHAKMVDNAKSAADILRKVENLRVDYAMFEGENHGSILPMAVGRGLRVALAATK